MASQTPRLAVLAAFTGDGGVERMIVNLLSAFVDEGVEVDLLLLKSRGGHLENIPKGVRRIDLHAQTSLLGLPAVTRYLRTERPYAMLVAKDRASRIALIARRVAAVDTRIVLRMGMHLSGSLTGKSWIRRWSRYLPVRWLYPSADRIITVSQAVADDLANIGKIPAERFAVIPNPTLPSDLYAKAQRAVNHPWLTTDNGPPVVMGAGRLTAQKDFETFLQAAAQVVEKQDARFIVLGEGPQRSMLESLRDQLGLSDVVDFVGFQKNPAAWLAKASVFALSSRFEGSPNVLIEAMALGTPVVATDCPSGPSEILDHGHLAPLVPIADPAPLAQAILTTLQQPTDTARLQRAVEAYRASISARQYLAILADPV